MGFKNAWEITYMVDGLLGGGQDRAVDQLELSGRGGRRLSRDVLAQKLGVVGLDRPPGRVGPRLPLERTREGPLDVGKGEPAHGRSRDGALGGGEGRVERRLGLEVEDGPNVVEVEGGFPREGAAEPGLEEGRPRASRLAAVVLADPGHPGVDGPAAGQAVRGRLSEEEVHEGPDVEGADEIGSREPQGVELKAKQGK